jgi:curved DNA-binding protein CbpA
MTKAPGLLPTAEGSFEKTPFVHLLVYMADRELSGTIVLSSPSQGTGDEHTVYFFLGAASKIRTGQPVTHLGRVLFELGLVTEDALNASLLARAGGSELQGEYLVRTGAIDRPKLILGLQAQATRQMAFLFDLPSETKFAFYQEANLLDDWGGPEILPLDPLPTIWSAVCARADEPIVEATLARLGATPLRLHEQSDVSRFGFSPKELAVVDLLRARPGSLSDLVASEVLPKRTIELIVYALLITRHLDHGAEAAPPVGIQRLTDTARLRAGGGVALARVKLARRVDVPPAEEPARKSSRPPLSPDQLARRESIVKRAESIDREDYFSMLGVTHDAPHADVQAAYYALAKTWHPDRLPPQLASVREPASKVFARINEAFETLSDPNRRKRYGEVLKGGGGTPEEANQIQQIIDAATDFQRGEILWKKRDPGAETFIMRAYNADPQQSDYIALYATFQLSKRAPDGPVDDLIKLCDRAIENNERCERAYFCRATLKKRVGKIDSAMADFRATYELNPKNLDAARELRLYEMRRGKHGDSRSSSAPRRSSPPGGSKSIAPSPKRTSNPPPPKKEGGVLSGIGKLFKR